MPARKRITHKDHFGLIRPALDAHTLGIMSLKHLLDDCGFTVTSANANVCEAANDPIDPSRMALIRQWIQDNRITILGFSYRLDPENGVALFERLVHELKTRRMLALQGGQIKALFFAGLPEACELARRRVPEISGVFCGDESPVETLRTLGVETSVIPRALTAGVSYDEARLAFGRDLISRAEYLSVKPLDRSSCEGFGTRRDTVMARIRHGLERDLPPLMRAHVGPYLHDRKEAVKLFLQWTRQLAASGLLDILSIGTSQLTQSAFGDNWEDRPNGGGVPLNSREEFAAVWQAARPMLVRAYAGTRDIPALARMYEKTINIAWHALSLWWFCCIDGRGPYSVLENLRQHFATLKYIAGTQKPFEPNIPHHFAFRGADDVTYVVSAVLAAKAAKLQGIRYLILQNMLNTPRYTWGVQDLAKSRALLQLARELEDDSFRIVLQPRGGLDYFSPDLNKAKAQLAAVTALMDDIEPRNAASPPVIHVVSYSEAASLAAPAVIEESLKITRHALETYRRLRSKGLIDDMTAHPEVEARTMELVSEARAVIAAVESAVANPYTAAGLYKIFVDGYLPVPYLWECRDEFRRAIAWQTRLILGSVKVVDGQGKPISAAERMQMVRSAAPGNARRMIVETR